MLMDILVVKDRYDGDDPYDLVSAVVDYVNALREAYYRLEELPEEALQSYYADYFLGEILNGGISQFIYNTRWNPTAVERVRTGLNKMGAVRHLVIFEKIAAAVDALGDDLESYLESDYFLENKGLRDALNDLDDLFSTREDAEDFILLNHNFIRKFSSLKVLPTEEYEAQMKHLCDSVPDKTERVRLALENEPEHYKTIRIVCQQAGQQVERFGGITYDDYKGDVVHKWHVLTSSGYHFVIFDGDKTLLFDDETKELIAEMLA